MRTPATAAARAGKIYKGAKMNRLTYQMSQEWHVTINRHNEFGMRVGWMYDALKMAGEVPRMAELLRLERRGELPNEHRQCSMSPVEPIPDNHLRCCLGMRCAKCPQLRALESMERVTPEDIDVAKAWTCAAHIAHEGGDMMNEGYIVTVGDRMFWDRVCENLSAE
jgi:hypothetical protein